MTYVPGADGSPAQDITVSDPQPGLTAITFVSGDTDGDTFLDGDETWQYTASLTDTMAAVLIIGGIMLQAGLTLATIKLAAILLFLLFTSPTASNALASAAILSGLQPEEGKVQPPERQA